MIRHIVAQGQTPAQLAERYGVSLAELIRLNALDLGLPVPAGVMLWVPEPPPSVRPGRIPATDPVLRVPSGLYDLLSARQGSGGGPFRLRIVRGPAGEPLELELP